MKIGIDYTAAVLQGAGIGRYTRGLVAALVDLLRPEDSVKLVCPREPAGHALPAGRGVSTVRLPLPDRFQTILWHRLRAPLPVDLWTGRLDIFHATNFLLPPVRRARTLVTIHDLAFLVRPQFAHPDLQRFLAAAAPRSVAAADHILADSEASRQDAIRLFGLAPNRVTVVGAGVEPRFRRLEPGAELERVRRRYGLEWPFVFSVSTLEPRKNFDGLIRAFAAARNQAGLPHHLVIAGGQGWLSQSIFDAVNAAKASDYVHFLGFTPDDDLPALYNLADLFAFPSHYEGFGLPVLEALACGVAVVCTDTSSLPELVGDAAHLVPTGDGEALRDALANLLSDGGARAALAARGPERARLWTWEAAAQRLYNVYTTLMAVGA